MSDVLKAIAVDDEKHCIDTLKWELERNCPNVKLMNCYQDAEEAYDALKEVELDILFLDIHLQSTSGIELLNRLLPVDYHVVFVTAYDEYAIQAFDLAATHYLLKPINGKKLKDAIDRIEKLREGNIDQQNMDRLLTSIKSEIGGITRIPFSVQSGVEFIDPDEIIYVGGENNYSILQLSGGKKIVVSKTLSHTEEVLKDHSFLRIHKSYLINLKYLRRYVKADGGHVELDNGINLPVSRLKRTLLNELFK